MTPEDLKAALHQLGLSHEGAGRLLGHPGGRQVRRRLSGDAKIPKCVGIVVGLLAAGKITVTDIEELEP